MSEVTDLLLRIRGDTSDAEQAIKRVDDAMRTTGGSATAAATVINQAFGPQISATTQAFINQIANVDKSLQQAGGTARDTFGPQILAAIQQVTSSVGSFQQAFEKSIQPIKEAPAAVTNLGSIINTALGVVAAQAILKLKSELLSLPSTFADALSVGADVTHAQDAFDNLSKSIGVVGSDYLPKLREASQGFISDLELMRLGSKAMLEGLSPNQFTAITASVTNLSKALGIDTVQAITAVERVLSTGRAAGLGGLFGISKPQIEELQAQLDGLTTPAAKLQAILEGISNANEAVGSTSFVAGDAIKQIYVSFANLYDKVSEYLGSNPELIKSFTDMRDTINGIDAKALADGIAEITSTAVSAASEIAKITAALLNLVSTTTQAKQDLPTSSSIADNLLPFPLNRVTQFGLGLGYQAGTGLKNQIDDSLSDEGGIGSATGDSFANYDNHRAIGAGKPAKEKIDAVTKALEQLGKKRDEIFAKAQTESDLLGLQKAIQSGDGGGIEAFAQKINQDTSDKLYAGLKDTLAKAGLSRESQQFGEILAATIKDNADKALLSVNDDITKNQAKAAGQALQYQLEDATKAGNIVAVQDLQNQIRNADWQSAYQNEKFTLIKNNVDINEADLKAREDASAKVALIDLENARKLEELQKQSFNNSVTLFSDLMSTAIDGTSADIEKQFTDSLKKVAIGFGAQIAANIAQSAGLNFNGNLSAGGIGQSLATSLGFGGGGVQGIGSLLGGGAPAVALTGSATALTSSAVALSSAAAALGGSAASQGAGGIFSAGQGIFSQVTGGGAATSGAGFGLVSGGSGPFAGATAGGGVSAGAGAGFATSGTLGSSSTLLASFGPLLSAAAVAGGVAGGAYLLNSGIKAGGTTGAEYGGAGGGLVGGSLLGGLGLSVGLPLGALAGFLGGQSQASIEGQNRQNFLSQFGDKYGGTSFNTVNGSYNLDPKQYNTTGLSSTSVGLANPIAQSLNGGDGKLTTDLAGIFAHGIGDAKNYNAELLNTQSLLGKLGTNAKSVEQVLFDEFKQGKISLDEYTAGVNQLEVVSQNTFQGKNGIAEGVKAVSDLLGKGSKGDNASLVGAVNGVVTVMNTLAKQGFTTTDQISQYFTKLGDGPLASVFHLFSTEGIKSIDDLNKAANDPAGFPVLVNNLQSVGDITQGLATTTQTTTTALTNTGTQGVAAQKNLLSAIQATTSAINNQTAAAQKLNSALSSAPKPGAASSTGSTGGDTTGAAAKTKSRTLNARGPNGL